MHFKKIVFLFVFLLPLFAIRLQHRTPPATTRNASNASFLLPTRSPSPTLISTIFPSTTPSVLAADEADLAQVERIIDGDTFRLENGQTVRLIGIDTPELHHPRIAEECFAREAAAFLSTLIEGKTIRLKKDVSETDRYGRLLRFAYTDTIFINDFLLRQGFATAVTFPPDVAHASDFRHAEQEARENGRGLWGACPTQKTDDFFPSVNQSAPTASCAIKGNISLAGEKIYHLPGQNYYDKTTIDESRGERWFCSEEEAVAAGWRHAQQ